MKSIPLIPTSLAPWSGWIDGVLQGEPVGELEFYRDEPSIEVIVFLWIQAGVKSGSQSVSGPSLSVDEVAVLFNKAREANMVLSVALCEGTDGSVLRQIRRRSQDYPCMLMFNLERPRFDEEKYVALGCTSRSSRAEVGKKYRELCLAYHPDRYSSANLPGDVVGMLEARFSTIHGAYKTVQAERGWQI